MEMPGMSGKAKPADGVMQTSAGMDMKGMAPGTDMKGMTAADLAGKAATADPGMKGMTSDTGMMMSARDLNDVNFDAFLCNDHTFDDPMVVKVEGNGRVRLRVINGAASTQFWITL